MRAFSTVIIPRSHAARSLQFLFSTSADAIISDLRPTSLDPLALRYINSLLDELLVSLITTSESINPYDLRRSGVPEIFTSSAETTGLRATGRAAVGEAELELRSWYEGHSSKTGFPPGGKGNGMKREGRFALKEAIDMMRVKCSSFSVGQTLRANSICLAGRLRTRRLRIRIPMRSDQRSTHSTCGAEQAVTPRKTPLPPPASG